MCFARAVAGRRTRCNRARRDRFGPSSAVSVLSPSFTRGGHVWVGGWGELGWSGGGGTVVAAVAGVGGWGVRVCGPGVAAPPVKPLVS